MVEMGVLKNRTAQKALFGLERYLLRRGQHAVVVTESFRRRVIEKGMRPEQVDVISNGVDTNFYYRDATAEPPLPALRRRSEREFVVGYLGNFGAGQEIRTVAEAAKLLEEELPNVRFVLAGDGTAKPQVERRAAELGVRNLTIHPPIQKTETRGFYNACDLCLVPLAPIPIFSETVPSKIFEVMACERPVLASVAGEAARIVEQSRGGATSPPGDAAGMAAAIRRLYHTSAEQRAAMGQRGRAYVSEHYSREALAGRYLEILSGITRSAQDGGRAGRGAL
jgi:glycosyltransferase involved in cell wall biosynthesis